VTHVPLKILNLAHKVLNRLADFAIDSVPNIFGSLKRAMYAANDRTDVLNLSLYPVERGDAVLEALHLNPRRRDGALT
jgi:hypothetical protein